MRLNQGKWKDGRSLAGLGGEVAAVDHKRHRVQVALKVGITVWCPPHCLDKLPSGAMEKSALLTRMTATTLVLVALFVIIGYTIVGAKSKDGLPNTTPVLSEGSGTQPAAATAAESLSGGTDQAPTTRTAAAKEVVVKEKALIARDDGCAVTGQLVNKELERVERVVVSAAVFDKNGMELSRNTLDLGGMAAGETKPFSILMPVDVGQVVEYKAEVLLGE